jgi:hypothetical protein
VRVFLEEVMFHFPSEIDAEPVGQLHLVECLLEQLQLGALGPRTRQLVLVEDSKLHGCPLTPSCPRTVIEAPPSLRNV